MIAHANTPDRHLPPGWRRVRLIGGPDDGMRTIARKEQRVFKMTHGLTVHVYHAPANGAAQFIHEDAIGGLR